MNWTIEIQRNPTYVEVITNGMADKAGSFNMAKEITVVMRKHRITRIVIDHRKITAIEGTMFEIYERPKILKMIGAVLKIKIAEIIKPEFIEHFRFLETVSLNQGFKMSIFIDKDEALKWLLE
jgi:hypothetical protein